MLYFLIFISKVLENALATLRLIIVSKGKKWLGAILQLITSLIWLISTGVVITNIKSDPLKVLFFALGCFIGSLVGSYIEEKIALGENILIVNSNNNNLIKLELEKNNTESIILNDETLIILIRRKQVKKIIEIILSVDKKAKVISEIARNLNK